MTPHISCRSFIQIELQIYRDFVIMTAHIYQLLKFDTNRITNSKMADKMATVQHYNWLYLRKLHFAVWQLLRWPFLSWLLITVYLPYEDDGNSIHALGLQLAGVEDLINSNPSCHILFNYNVDFSCNWQHTHIVNEFCDNNKLFPVMKRSCANIYFTYHFNTSRFNILDHFIVWQFIWVGG